MLSVRRCRVLGILVLLFALTIGVACTGASQEEARQKGGATSLPASRTSATPVGSTPSGGGIAPTKTALPTETQIPVPLAFAIDDLNIREGPGLGYQVTMTEPRNALGTVLEGPVEADGHVWWRLRYEDGVVGWSAEEWLRMGVTLGECDFSKSIDLRRGSSYDVMGGDAFDTLVCGYAKLVPEDWFGQTQFDVYLAIVDYTDDGFIRAVGAEIGRGNTVNRKGPSYYEFDLGCFEDDKIVGGADMDPETMQAVLESSPDRLVSVMLSFELQAGGRGCGCCSLAERVRLY